MAENDVTPENPPVNMTEAELHEALMKAWQAGYDMAVKKMESCFVLLRGTRPRLEPPHGGSPK